MRVLAVRAPGRCAVCHDALDGRALQGACPRCGARGHLPCMGDLGRCPTLGCARPGGTGAPASPAPARSEGEAEPGRGRVGSLATASCDRPFRAGRWAFAAAAGLVVGGGLLLLRVPTGGDDPSPCPPRAAVDPGSRPSPHLRSRGPDGVLGTADDLCSCELDRGPF